MTRLCRWMEPVWAFFLILFYLLGAQGEYVTSGQWYPLRDSIGYHFPAFWQFAESLAHGYGFPRLVLEWGGSEVGMSNISMGYYLPYRLLGYLLYLLLPSLAPLVVYKLTLVIGASLALTGFYILSSAFSKSRLVGSLITLAFAASGFFQSIWHQEQVIMTVTFAPWTYYGLLRWWNDRDSWRVFAFSFGAMFTTHQPHLHFLAFLAVVLSLAVFRFSGAREWFKSVSLKTWSLVLVTIFISSLPTLWVAFKQSQYGSPARHTASVLVPDYQEYVRVNKQQESSATTEYMLNLIWPSERTRDDGYAYVSTILTSLFLVIGIFICFANWRKRIWLVIASVLLIWLCGGINSYAAQVLYKLHFPGIALFRQWYHFAPYVQMAVHLLAATALVTLNTYLNARKKWQKAAIILTLSILWSWEGISNHNTYRTRYLGQVNFEIPRLNDQEFLFHYNRMWLSDFFKLPYSTPVVAFREAIALFLPCENTPFEKSWFMESAYLYKQVSCGDFLRRSPLPPGVLQIEPHGVWIESSRTDLRIPIIALNHRLFASPPAGLKDWPGRGLSYFQNAGRTFVEFKGLGFELLILLQYLLIPALALSNVRFFTSWGLRSSVG